MSVESAIHKAINKLGFSSVKPQQMMVVREFINRRDVFVVLPTGFGKTLCFTCLPIVFDELCPDSRPSIILVVTPLIAIMQDQVTNLRSRGVSTGITGVDPDMNVLQGDYQILFISPELLFARKWRFMLLSDVYAHRLRAFIVDEAHTCKEWDETFRRVLSRVGEVRSLLPKRVNIMALTATATVTLRKEVARMISMKNEAVIAMSPNRFNIIYSVKSMTTIAQIFSPLVSAICEMSIKVPKTIIYCRTRDDVANLYLFFKTALKENFVYPTDAPDHPDYRIVDMYMSSTDPQVKQIIAHRFTTEENPRVLIATVAFGMGIDCPDVRQVIHYGSPNNTESYVQETGRAGRDGLTAVAILLVKPIHKKPNQEMSDYISNITVCRRVELFKNFDNWEEIYACASTNTCCDICNDLNEISHEFVLL